MKNSDVKTIVFITGLFISNSCWDEWTTFFEEKGYTCLAPPHPHKSVSAELLRSRHPNVKVASVTLKRLIDYYADLIKQLPENPILIGHSMGGLLVQLLLQQNIGVAGVAIHPVPPRGIFPLQWTTLRTVWKALGIFTPVKETYLMSLQQWQTAFTNGMSPLDQRRTYYQYVIPESKKIPREVLTKAARIQFNKPHPPLLIMAGGNDKMAPASVNRTIYRKYKKSNSVTDYVEFKDRNHFVVGQSAWQENAEYIVKWLNKE